MGIQRNVLLSRPLLCIFFICIYNYNVLSSKCILSTLLHFMTSIASFKITFIIEHLLLGKIPYKNITHHIKLMIYLRRETERLHCNNWLTLLSWLEATEHVSGDWLWLIKWQAEVYCHGTCNWPFMTEKTSAACRQEDGKYI